MKGRSIVRERRIENDLTAPKRRPGQLSDG
jgi:hypothetical protein